MKFFSIRINRINFLTILGATAGMVGTLGVWATAAYIIFSGNEGLLYLFRAFLFLMLGGAVFMLIRCLPSFPHVRPSRDQEVKLS